MTTDIALECADCGVALDHDESVRQNDDGDRICEDCSENYVTCEDCGETISRDSEHRDESGNPICESCAEHYSTCGECDRIIHEDHGTWISRSDMTC